MSPRVSAKVMKEKIRLVIKLRDEQNLTFKQIAVQVNRHYQWCSKVYHEK